MLKNKYHKFGKYTFGLSASISVLSRIRSTPSQISSRQCYWPLSFPLLFSRPLLPLHLRSRFGIIVSCTRSGGGPIRKCACSCPTWKGHTPRNVLCRPSRPRKWLTRPSYECWMAATGIFKLKPTETLSKKLINHITELLHFIWTILRRERSSLSLCSFIEALDVNYYSIGQPHPPKWFGTHSGIIVGVDTQRLSPDSECWDETTQTEHVDVGLTAWLYSCDEKWRNPRTQTNVAGYYWFSMLLQYNTKHIHYL